MSGEGLRCASSVADKQAHLNFLEKIEVRFDPDSPKMVFSEIFHEV